MRAMPETLQVDLVASRELRPQAILFKVLETFQPGGVNERSEGGLNSYNTGYHSGGSCASAQVMEAGMDEEPRAGGIYPGSSSLGGVDTVMRSLFARDSRAVFRVSKYRVASEVDIRPTAATVMQYHDLLQSEADLMVSGTVASGMGAKSGGLESSVGIKAMSVR